METWTFSGLTYERPDLEQLKKQVVDLTQAVRRADSAGAVFDVIMEHDRLVRHFSTLHQIAQIRNTIDTRDAFYDAEIEWLSEQTPLLSPLEVAFSDAIAESPYREEIGQRFGKQFFTGIDLQKKMFCEKNIPLIQRESKLTLEYQKMMAACQIEFDGKTLNLYGIQKYFEHEDRTVREAAFRAYSGFYQSHEERLEQIWDELISIRNEMGRNLGFDNFIPLAYMQQGRTDYGAEEVASFREQVRKELVPLCEKLYEAQAGRLGIDHVMVFDEKRIFPDGNARPAGDDDFMVDQARKMYHDMSLETGEFIDFMIGHGLMDLKNKPGKASTGYMTYLMDELAPFVFSCFNGTIFDMQVLTHELGHAFAGYMAMRSQPIADYFSESTDIAEIHSMSMEQFAYPYAEMFFGEDADKFRFAHLQEAFTFVPFGVAVDEFQHICYAHPELSPKERTFEWHKLEEKYMPWRRYKDDAFMERGGFWYHKLHIYLYPFYYINYTLTTMGAMEFKKKNALDHQKAWEDYMNLCRVGGSISYLETLKLANLSVPFEEGSVKKAISYAAQILMKEIGKE